MSVLDEDNLDIVLQLKESTKLLEELAGAKYDPLLIQNRLRESYSPDFVRAALSLIEARRRAHTVLPEGHRLWVTKVAIEQATAPIVAEWKAAQFPPGEMIYDLCCGMGVDTQALLQRGPVTSIDTNATALQRCEWNLNIWNQGQLPSPWKSSQQDAQLFDVKDKLIHIDPDRRTHSDRPAKRLEQYCPDLACLQSLAGKARGASIKLGPASNFMQKFPDCRIELISLKGECREATVWTGELAGDAEFQATSLPSGETLCGNPLDAWSHVDGVVGDFVFDPDPAIVRSGLLDLLAEKHGLRRLDSADEYLTGDARPSTSFVKSFETKEVMGNNDKTLRKFLRSCPATSYEIKCRHLKTDADALRRRLPVGDGPPLTVLFARIDGKAKIIVAERCSGSDQPIQA